MNLQRCMERPFFKLVAKCLAFIFCAVVIAYMTAEPHRQKRLVTSHHVLNDVQLQYVNVENVSENFPSGEAETDIVEQPTQKDESAEEIAFVGKRYDPPWTFVCVQGVCQRTLVNDLEGKGGKVPLDVCWLNCGQYGPLWPIPTHSESVAGKNLIPFQLSNLRFSLVDNNFETIEVQEALEKKFGLVLNVLRQMNNSDDYITENKENVADNIIQVTVKLTSPVENIKFLLDSSEENYKLQISSTEEMEDGGVTKVNIEASTYFGVRHALETFTQLVAYDEINSQYKIVGDVTIEDKPTFRYRGVLVDVARNFMPLTTLRRIVDGMSYNKMNVLHIHFTDIESFSVLHHKFPEMSLCGSYSKKKTYKLEELTEFVKYARVRGIKIVPEFDPNHLRFLGNLTSFEGSSCVNRNTKENNGFLVNLFDPDVLTSIGEFYKSLLTIFDDDVIHFGSFDLSFDSKCLKSQNDSKLAQEWMKKENITDFAQLRPSFLNKVIEKIKEVNDGKSIQAIIFASDFPKSNFETFNHSSYIMQTWDNVESSRRLVKEKYRIVISDTRYSKLNSGFNGPDHNYNLWQSLYDCNFHSSISSTQILGSEVLIWTQNTNAGSIEAKLWPRASALAERLWSNPKSRAKDVYSRLNHHNSRMINRGMRTESLQPESCYLISGNCDDPHHPI